MKALVTGGGGFLGGAIVRLLRERGDTVRSFSRGDYPELARLGVDQARGDLADREAVVRAAEGCDIVFHVAAKAGIWGSVRRLLPGECDRDGKRPGRLPRARHRAAGLHRIAERGLRRPGHRGGR